jgi:hypothetical protein
MELLEHRPDVEEVQVLKHVRAIDSVVAFALDHGQITYVCNDVRLHRRIGIQANLFPSIAWEVVLRDVRPAATRVQNPLDSGGRHEYLI